MKILSRSDTGLGEYLVESGAMAGDVEKLWTAHRSAITAPDDIHRDYVVEYRIALSCMLGVGAKLMVWVASELVHLYASWRLPLPVDASAAKTCQKLVITSLLSGGLNPSLFVPWDSTTYTRTVSYYIEFAAWSIGDHLSAGAADASRWSKDFSLVLRRR